jgi:rhodanese-related sulfurtransferase
LKENVSKEILPRKNALNESLPKKSIRAGWRIGRVVMAFALAVAALAAPAAAAASVAARAAGEDWSAPYVKALADEGVIAAPGGLFRPAEEVTLGDFVSWLVSAKSGAPVSEAESVAVAREKGFLDPALPVGGPVTRSVAAQVTALALEALFGEAPADDALAQQLKDFASCSSCRLYVSQCYVKGIMTGREDRVFDGDAVLTRAEGAVVALRVLKPEFRKPPEPDGDGPILLAPDAARRLLDASPGAVLLDVRNENELANGYIKGSVLVPLATLKATGAAALARHGKSDVIIVYCQSGGRSAQASAFLRELGYAQVFDMGGVGNWPFGLSYPQ